MRIIHQPCSLPGSCVFKVKQYEATLFFALLRCTETEFCCCRLPLLSLCWSWWLSEERGPVIAVGRLCVQMTSLCCSLTARHGGQTPLLGPGGRGRFAWFTRAQALNGQPSPGAHITGRAVFMSPWPWRETWHDRLELTLIWFTRKHWLEIASLHKEAVIWC